MTGSVISSAVAKITGGTKPDEMSPERVIPSSLDGRSVTISILSGAAVVADVEGCGEFKLIRLTLAIADNLLLVASSSQVGIMYMTAKLVKIHITV